MAPIAGGRQIATIVFLGGVYFVAAKVGLKLAFFHPSATPVWPPTGIALASLLLLGYRVWPGIFLGAFLANLTTHGTAWTSLGIATGNTLEGLVGAYLVNQYARGSNAFDRPQDIFKLAIFSAVVSTTVSATTGVTSLALGGYAPRTDYRSIWLTWWLGDAAGALTVGPLIILWSKHPRLRWDISAALERAFFLAGLLAVSWVVFTGAFSFEYLTVPFLVWAAFRFDRRETATVIALLTAIAVWATVKGHGPFVGATPNESLLQLQVFMGIMVLVALPLVSVVAEREAANKKARDRTEAGFRLMFAGNPLPMWVYERETLRFLEVNDAAIALYGYSRDEFLCMRIPDIRPPEEVDRLHRYMSEERRHLRHAGEWRHRRKDGQLVYVEISSHDFQLAERPAVLVVAKDVSERRQAEVARRESEERFRELFENANDLVFTTDLEGRFTSVNKAAERVTGYTREELLAMGTRQLLAAESLESAGQQWQRRTAQGEAASYTLEIAAKDGRRVPLEVSTRLIYRQGIPVGIQGIARDITERKKADVKFRSLLEAAPDAIVIVDREGRIVLVNAQTETLFGYTRDELLGAPVESLMPERFRGACGSHRAGYAANPHAWSMGSGLDLFGLRKDRTEFPVEISLSPLEAEEGMLTISAIRDVTERKRAEDALRGRASLMSRLLALGSTLNRPFTMPQVVEAIGRAAFGLSGADRAAVYVCQPNGTVTCPWSQGLSSRYVAQTLAHLQDFPFGRMLTTQDRRSLGLPWGQVVDGTNPMLFPDVQALSPESSLCRLARGEGYRALGGWPLVYEGRVIGVATCYYDAPRTWGEAEREVFLTFSQQAAVALQNAYLYDARAQQTAELQSLYELSKQLRAAQTPTQIYPLLVENAMALLGAQHGALSLLDRDRRTFTRVLTRGAPGEEPGSTFPAEGSHSGEVVRTGEPFVVTDFRLHAPAWLDRAPYRRLGPLGIVPLRSEEEVIGTLALGRFRPPRGQSFTDDDVRLLAGIADMGGTAIQRSRLHQNLEEAYLQMVVALATAVESRDTYTADHSERIARWAEAVARKLNRGEVEIQDIRRAAWLHDIGKIGIPDSILRKPMSLTKAEWAVMRQHPVIGEEILSSVDRMRGVAKLVRHHQERWDGTGYPDRLKGEQIPLGARILAVVDAYSAMIDIRPYKKARTHTEAMAELRRCAGTQFDPRIVAVFCDLERRRRPRAAPGSAALKRARVVP